MPAKPTAGAAKHSRTTRSNKGGLQHSEAAPEAPTRTQRPVMHDNGSVELTFQANIGSSLPPSGAHGTTLNEPQMITFDLAALTVSDSTVPETRNTAVREALLPQADTETYDLDAVSSESDEELPLRTTSQSSAVTAQPPTNPSPVAPAAALPVPTSNTTSSASQLGKSKSTAQDVHTFFKEQPETPGFKTCILCVNAHAIDASVKIARYQTNSSTTSYRTHLSKAHLESWVDMCDHLKIPIGGEKFVQIAEEYRAKSRGSTANQLPSKSTTSTRPVPFSSDAFLDAIVEFIVSNDQACAPSLVLTILFLIVQLQSINVIESPQLRRLFLMLRESLTDDDIPHRTLVRKRVLEVWNDHLKTLSTALKSALGKVSFTSDLWSDSNLSPFMAVTAHWIEARPVQTTASTRPQYLLSLRSELIGFHQVPGRHTGSHLAEAFFDIIDRLGIDQKIGWITLDNATNNDTLLEKLETDIRARGISFSRHARRIRCFPHIVNLACKAVIAHISKADNSREPTSDAEWASLLNAVRGDPLATLRAAIRAIRSSSLRRQYFAKLVLKHLGSEYQLLRDMDVRWSSTYLMVDRAIVLEMPLMEMIQSAEFPELHKYRLSEDDWEALSIAHEILSVPHRFQQLLSAEKTPTLCAAIPAFEQLKRSWKDLQLKYPRAFTTIQCGIDKLEEYSNRADTVPAYNTAMILNPGIKLAHYRVHASDHVETAKTKFLNELHPYFMDVRRQHAASNTIASPSQPAVRPPPSDVGGPSYPEGTPRRIRRERAAAHAVMSNSPAELLGLVGQAGSGVNLHSASAMTLEAEVKLYLDEPLSEMSNALNYWQENQLRFPVLFRAALDYMAIQGSAVPCERVFSSAKETMTARRSRIKPDLMEALQMLKFSVNQGDGINFTHGLTTTELQDELEQYLHALDGDS